jgi:cytidine deaminase
MALFSSNDPSHVSQACKEYSITSTQFSVLCSRSQTAKASAYCPYSRFRVGATILTHDDQYIDGANVENASYPVGTCAERVAFGKAVTEGHKKFKALAVATDISPPASPCGMCRQLSVVSLQFLKRASAILEKIWLPRRSYGRRAMLISGDIVFGSSVS